MKIQELFEETIQDYTKRIVDKLGIEELGKGAYSKVFQHPQFNNVVTKVYSAKDKVYSRYVKWCLKNQNNPYVPQIIEEVKYRSGSNQFNILFMEKMKSIRTSGGFATQFIKSFNFKDEDVDEDSFNNVDDFIASNDLNGFFFYIDDLVKNQNPDKNFKAWWNHVKSYGVDYFDLHQMNAMMRGTQLVFTDPVANTPESSNWAKL